MISHGPMIQPKSANQKRRSAGRTSNWNATSSAIFADEAAVDVDRSLGPPGRAGRVGDEQRVLAVDHAGRLLAVVRVVRVEQHPVRLGSSTSSVVPTSGSRASRGTTTMSRALSTSAAAARATPTHVDAGAPPQEPVGGDERLGAGVHQAHRDRVRAVAREERQEDAADLGHGHARPPRPRGPSAGRCRPRRRRPGRGAASSAASASTCGPQLPVGQLADLAVLALPHDRDARRAWRPTTDRRTRPRRWWCPR